MDKITLVNSEVMKENISFCRGYLPLNHAIKIEANEIGMERGEGCLVMSDGRER